MRDQAAAIYFRQHPIQAERGRDVHGISGRAVPRRIALIWVNARSGDPSSTADERGQEAL
jgi:hypothetical protein